MKVPQMINKVIGSFTVLIDKNKPLRSITIAIEIYYKTMSNFNPIHHIDKNKLQDPQYKSILTYSEHIHICNC